MSMLRSHLIVFTVVLMCCSSLVSSNVMAAGNKRAKGAKVTVTVDRRAYPDGTPAKVTIANRTRAKIALPGCASFTLEQFEEEEDRYSPLPPRRCPRENNAIIIPRGERVFEFNPLHDTRAILRVVVTYGERCREGVPLSSARCSSVHTVRSRPFILLEAPAR